ncbi:helix-turn-helix domain-containing protein [Rhodococcoides fascians A25f]|uniref:helix-turn-helix domain-containing protein n=1 Tax=Rhodococcoides fascians TaxID=1828 RepID=UPI0013FDDD65|nr:helix-turn-helix domain-containing protein [Rhodococcus fascians]QII04351.1 helix-turn-helix domain-containing protein [Rhodococcus fascians A25f]
MPGSTKFLALVLATFSSSRTGSNVHPSVARLAREMEVSERTVNRGMDWLRNHGWIVRVRQGNRWKNQADEYRLSLPSNVLEVMQLDPDSRPYDGSLSDTDDAQTPEVHPTPMSLRLVESRNV